MPTDRAIELVEFDNTWGISTGGIYSILWDREDVSYAMVTIPINQIEGMSYKDIGKMVKLLAPKAKKLAYLENNKRLAKNQKQMEYKKPKKHTEGWVYILKDPYGHYKIGMTTRTPGERLCEFSPRLPFVVDFLFAIKTDNADNLESDLHNKFSDKRVNGEWFTLNENDINYMREMI